LEMTRDDGILLVRFHTDDGPFQWGFGPHEILGSAFADIGADRENRVVIFTGTGAVFSGPMISADNVHFAPTDPPTASQWDVFFHDARRLVMNLLDIEVPIISAINGPVHRHAELVLMNDLVLCADDTTFEDAAHFAGGGMVPGDGMHVLFPLLLGTNRARYLMYTGQRLSAHDAYAIGVVGEVLPRVDVLPRAFELAATIRAKPPLLARYTRLLLTQQLKRQMLDNLALGMAVEGLAATDRAR
jgi:enoyl-CoA hydratase/carnithine racemase